MLQLRNGLLTPEAMGPTVLSALNQARMELESGALLSLDAARARLRVLPLGN